MVEGVLGSADLCVLNQPDRPATFRSDLGHCSWIDVTAASHQLAQRVTGWRVLDELDMGSDHHLIVFKITAGVARGWTRKVRDWKSVDWVHLQQDLHSSLQLCPDLFRNIDSPETLNVYERALTANIQQVVDRHVHFKQICEFSKSWWTAEIRELRQRQNRLRRRWARSGHEEDRIAFLQGRRQLRNAIIKAKKKAWQDFCSETGRDDHWRLYGRVVRP